MRERLALERLEHHLDAFLEHLAVGVLVDQRRVEGFDFTGVVAAPDGLALIGSEHWIWISAVGSSRMRISLAILCLRFGDLAQSWPAPYLVYALARDADTYGGSFLYHAENNEIAVGFVVELNTAILICRHSKNSGVTRPTH